MVRRTISRQATPCLPFPNRKLNGPVAPAALARAKVSARKLAAPRAVFEFPPRNRAWTTSPVAALVANKG